MNLLRLIGYTSACVLTYAGAYWHMLIITTDGSGCTASRNIKVEDRLVEYFHLYHVEDPG